MDEYCFEKKTFPKGILKLWKFFIIISPTTSPDFMEQQFSEVLQQLVHKYKFKWIICPG